MELAPETIGPYRLLEPLGRGGMGVVWRAEHPQTRQSVALKTVRLPSQAILQSLRREIHALARIRHPGVVRIVEHGVQDGAPWYAMELLEGVTLGRALQEPAASRLRAAAPTAAWWTRSLASIPEAGAEPGPEPPAPERRAWSHPALRKLLTLVGRLCSPLAFLHGEGIVHRDLKPDNVLVGKEQRPVIVDFGLASHFGGELSREALQTAAGAAGSVAYMAPEQARGDIVDARADLYALGCILFELLTGKLPFAGQSPAQVLHKHFNAEPPRPSEHCDGVPQALDELVLRLMAKQPRLRLGHAADVASALQALGAEALAWPEAPAPRPYLYRPGLAGRLQPLETLGSHLEALQQGQGGLLLIGGESGVGKTRLLLEISREAQRKRLLLLASEALPEVVASPLGSLRPPLQRMADRCKEKGPAETERVFGPRRPLLALFEPSLRALSGLHVHPEPVELPADAARLRLFTALADTFAVMAADAPLLLLLDDLHWADELTIGWLELLLRGRLEGMALLVIGAYRSEEPGAALQRVLGSEKVERLALPRLEEAEVGSIVGDMLALSPPPALFTRFLSVQSEGNPFFVAEYLRAALAEGLLRRDSQGMWQVIEPSGARAGDANVGKLPLPRSIHDLVLRRIETLSLAARELAAAAAVLGREMEAALLAEVAGLQPADLLEPTRELLVRQVLEEREPGCLRFAHDKLREVAYERLAPQQRRELHRAAAEVLEARPAEQRVASQAALGQHWEQAGRPEKASSFYLAAARHARDTSALADAEHLYRAFLRLSEESSAENIAARNELAYSVLRLQGRIEEALQELAAVLEAAHKIGDRAAEAQTLRALGFVHLQTEHVDAARAYSEQALQLARELGDTHSEAAVFNNLGILQHHLGGLEEARRLLQQAVDIARGGGDLLPLARYLGNLANLLREQGCSSQARPLFEESLALFRQVASRTGEGMSLGNMAMLLMDEGRHEEGRKLHEEALAIHREIGNRISEGITLLNLAELSAESGEVETAQALFVQARASQHEAGNRHAEAMTMLLHALLERRSGRIEEAERLLRDAEALLGKLGNRLHLVILFCELAHVALARGRPAGELAERAQALAEAARAGPDSGIGQSLSRLRRAQQALEAGQPLLHGECPEDVPETLRRRFTEIPT